VVDNIAPLGINAIEILSKHYDASGCKSLVSLNVVGNTRRAIWTMNEPPQSSKCLTRFYWGEYASGGVKRVNGVGA
jgi:hypothetical protein